MTSKSGTSVMLWFSSRSANDGWLGSQNRSPICWTALFVVFRFHRSTYVRFLTVAGVLGRDHTEQIVSALAYYQPNGDASVWLLENF